MTNESTLEKLKLMRLNGMVRAFGTAMESGFDELTADELVAHIVDAEWDERADRKLSRLLTSAKFRYKTSIESINYEYKRNLNKNSLVRLANCSWIKKAQNIIITGPTGTGKSFIACALGNSACMNGFSVVYYNTMKLFNALKISKADGTYVKEIDRIKKSDVLIMDDFGLGVFDKHTSLFLLEIIEDRHGQKSTIITSQFPVTSWFEKIGDPTTADAICDRILHSSHKIPLKGGSIRKMNANDLT